MIEAAAPRHVEAVRELFLDNVTPSELRMPARISGRVVEELDEEPSCPERAARPTASTCREATVPGACS